MQKGKGVCGGLRWWVLALMALALPCPSGLRGYDLPGAIERGMGRVGIPRIYRSQSDSLYGKPALKISISYSNPYSIDGLDSFEVGSILRTGGLAFRSVWRSLSYTAYREDRADLTLYAGVRGLPVVPVLTTTLWRCRAGLFDPERGKALMGGILLPVNDSFLVEAVTPLSGRPDFLGRGSVLTMMLRWGPFETCGDLRFADKDLLAARYGLRVMLGGAASVLAGYDVMTSVMTAGVMIARGRTGFVFAREYHPVLGGTPSAGVEHRWSR